MVFCREGFLFWPYHHSIIIIILSSFWYYINLTKPEGQIGMFSFNQVLRHGSAHTDQRWSVSTTSQSFLPPLKQFSPPCYTRCMFWLKSSTWETTGQIILGRTLMFIDTNSYTWHYTILELSSHQSALTNVINAWGALFYGYPHTSVQWLITSLSNSLEHLTWFANFSSSIITIDLHAQLYKVKLSNWR